MKLKIIQILIILAVITSAFLALYLQSPPEHSPYLKEVPSAKDKKPYSKSEPFSQFQLQIDPQKPSHIAIIGEGGVAENSDEPFNSSVLKKLFGTLEKEGVNAVFFNGNLISETVAKSDGSEKVDRKLENDLQKFSEIYESYLGTKVPLYPILGSHELSILNSAKTFSKHFHLEGARVAGNALHYTVSAGQAYFIVVATETINKKHHHQEHAFSEEMLEWLKKELIEGAQYHRYLFVLGYEPVYQSSHTYLKDDLIKGRDIFWNILVKHGVIAYFSSKEHLFDRSNRSGVWQIISGGGGALLSHGGGTQPFHHALILTIPAEVDEDSDASPSIRVIDDEGRVVDEFNLNSERQPLYQMRIS